MGGCFPCWGSSNQAGTADKEAAKAKDGVAKESSIVQSHQVGKLNSGKIFKIFVKCLFILVEFFDLVSGVVEFSSFNCSMQQRMATVFSIFGIL